MNLFLSLNTILLPVISNTSFSTSWQSAHARRFLTILITIPGGVLMSLNARASFSPTQAYKEEKLHGSVVGANFHAGVTGLRGLNEHVFLHGPG